MPSRSVPPGKTHSWHPSADPIVEVRDLRKSHEGAVDAETSSKTVVKALRGLTFTINRGDLVAILGPSGSGKSTLLQLIGGLDKPTSGMVKVNGQDLSKLDDNALTRFRRDNIGFVFQFFNLLPTLNVLENVMLPSLLAGVKARTIRPKAEAQLEAVGLRDKMKRRPDQLSGGEMQRVAIARALVTDPPLVLADEPTGNLDSKTGEAVLELLEYATTEKRTVILVTHDLRVSSRADLVMTIRDGKVEYMGSGGHESAKMYIAALSGSAPPPSSMQMDPPPKF